jgi:hypothetical protein
MDVVPLANRRCQQDSTQPRTIHRYRRNIPRRAPCPRCGTLGRRKQILPTRTVRGIAYRAVLLLHITTGEYRASCSCCTTFRTQIDDIEAKAHYSNSVREAVIDRLLDDHMNLDQIQFALHRDFYLDLSQGFLHDCITWKIGQLDLPDYRQWTRDNFSGTLCIDELHLGPYTLLLATDPLHDFPLAFALVASNDQEHMARFLGQLRDHGFRPRVVVTDGSSLYPKVLAAVWPEAEHQLCIFHVLKDLNQHVLDAVRDEHCRLKRQGAKGRRRGRGRPKKNRKCRTSTSPTLRQQAQFLFKHRHLIFKRRDHFKNSDRHHLQLMLEYAPTLRTLRLFVDEVYSLFQVWRTPEQARDKRSRLCANGVYAANPHLAKALAMLTPEPFEKMIAFLGTPVGRRVRTNNHVERTNRKLRLYEKIRYRWRRRPAIVRFVILVIARQWEHRRTSRKRTSPGGLSGHRVDPNVALPKDEAA